MPAVGDRPFYAVCSGALEFLAPLRLVFASPPLSGMPLQQTEPQRAAVDKHSGARESVAWGHAAWEIAALGGTGAPAGAFADAGFVCTAAAAAGRVQARAAGSIVHTAPGGASCAAA